MVIAVVPLLAGAGPALTLFTVFVVSVTPAGRVNLSFLFPVIDRDSGASVVLGMEATV